ncbi:hypothetical protein GCM10022225_51500 [Plantactinospora mayteni]|uniref:Uncharacterized protein n=1 Tax=Plantactinospora mayteni TaxID=566021 RepID=A0ABQ4EZ46_9ACTN|nr:DUF5995 family protein [Plantactinospora mayteni]GIG99933.1 hypothetical protein Pma05_65060 [Plantactinospora mayteni]
MGRRAATRALLAATLGVTGVLSPAPPVAAAPSPSRPAGAAVRAVVPDTCPDGGSECVADTIGRLRERFGALGRSCQHHASFTLAYLRTTEGFRWGRDQEGYFVDNAWVNREGALFAEYYYRAYDDWAAGRRSAVPAAWLAALDAARSRRLTGAGDLLLGMNAHINRDLPYVLERVGLTAPDGSSRKPDHDKVNEILAAVLDPLLAELIARLDRDGFDTGIPTSAALGLLVSWREQAWRNAVRLAGARTPFARTLVELDIESGALAIATGLATLTSYVPPFTGPGPRAAYCAGHNGDAPPLAYPFGVPPAY